MTFGQAFFDYFDFSNVLINMCRALAELLGQVKPPVATKDDIEHSGLQVIKTEKIAEYAQNGQIAINTIERVSLLAFKCILLLLKQSFL